VSLAEPAWRLPFPPGGLGSRARPLALSTALEPELNVLEPTQVAHDPLAALVQVGNAVFANYLRIEGARTRKGDETSAHSHEDLGTQCSQYWFEWPFPAATLLSGEPRGARARRVAPERRSEQPNQQDDDDDHRKNAATDVHRFLPSSVSFLAALDTDVEAEKQKRPGQDGCDRRQDLPHRRDRVEVVVDRRDHDTDNDPDDGQESYPVPAHALGLPVASS
jgi:hypothetical protein